MVNSKTLVSPGPTMHWSMFLHLYQPAYQQPDVLERIVGQSYRPLIQGLVERAEARLTLNVSAVLLELLHTHGYHDIIEALRTLGERGQVEFLGSAKFHTLLPFIPDAEVLRQIDLHDATAKHYLGNGYKRRGIFLPEMAYSPHLDRLIEQQGFDYVLLDEICYNGETNAVDYSSLHTIEGSKLYAMFRQRRLSNLIMHGTVRDLATLKRAADTDLRAGKYVITGMDGEVFGHHHTGHENLLFMMLENPQLGMTQVRDLIDVVQKTTVCRPVAASWADSERDLATDQPFYTWRDPKNPLQKLEWSLQSLTLEEFAKIPHDHKQQENLHKKLDRALASDLYFWSSGRPWWSIELIEEGAYGLLEVVEGSPSAANWTKLQARDLYNRIMALAFEWRRDGTLAEIGKSRDEILRVPFRDRADGPVFEAFVALMRAEQAKAAAAEDYEEAILWRDAIFKLVDRRDAYDAYHVVDQLRAKISDQDVEAMIARYSKGYHEVRGGQAEQRSN